MTLFGIELWPIFLALSGYFLFFWMMEYAVKLKREITPKFSVTFAGEAGGVVETPEKLKDQSGQTLSERRAIFIRIAVENLSAVTVQNCRAYIIEVLASRAGGSFVSAPLHDPIELPWAHLGVKDISLHPKIKRHADVLRTDEDSNRITFPAVWPLTLRNLFDEPKSFIFKIAVVGGGVTAVKSIRVIWKGAWDTFEVHEHDDKK